MLFNKESGILLHPTCLPSPYGVGDLGLDAYRFIDVLAAAGQRLWQVLPLTPPGNGACPYQGESSFAGDPLLISPAVLAEEGLLLPAELNELVSADLPAGRYEFELTVAKKLPVLRRAAKRFADAKPADRWPAFEVFCRDNRYWLLDYARFKVLKRHFHGAPWYHWPAAVRHRVDTSLESLDQDLASEMMVESVLQFFFEEQWGRLRRYASKNGIRILGDVPIFVAHDSADTWANQDLFQLDGAGQPTVVAGVPPDYFSKDGQRWGNPLFFWPTHEASDFAWWRARVKRTLAIADLLRIDHFRGLAACWEVPVDAPTAKQGKWVSAPGDALLASLIADWGTPLPVVAEDLGVITDDVVALRDKYELPSMRILQFSFNGEEAFLPHNYPSNCVAYTGTHDNDTTVGWYTQDSGHHEQMSKQEVERERDQVRRYYSTDGTNIHWTLMKGVLACPAAAAIIPFQDVLGLGSEARMNTPGTVSPRNWSWRFQWAQLNEDMITGLLHITREAGRAPEIR